MQTEHRRQWKREWAAKHREENRARDARRFRDIQANRPAELMFKRTRQRAKRTGLEFNLTVEDCDIPSTCPVLGIPLIVGIGAGRPTPNSPSIDRLDPSRGYVKGNVRVISHRANGIKNAATLDEIERVIAYVRSLESG